MWSKNTEYTLDAVELAHKCGCKKFVGSGSQAEYGRVDGVIHSTMKCAPENSYGISKYAAGLLSAKQCEKYGMTRIWGRIFSVYGKNDNDGTMLDYAIKQFAKREKAYFSSGIQPWDYLYEKDAGKIFYLIGEKVKSSRIYNVASGHSMPLREYIKIVADIMDASDLCEFAPPTSESPLGLQADIGDLKNDIGIEIKEDFDVKIKQMIL